jgi:hypothetical protein
MVRARHRLYLADNLWLTSHDERFGKCYVSPVVLGLGLAGALLGELVLWGRLDCTPVGELQLLDSARVDDSVVNEVLRRIVAEMRKPSDDRTLHVSAWLASLGPFAKKWVTDRLLEAKVIDAVHYEGGWLKKAKTRYVVVDVNGSRIPVSNLTGRLSRREPIGHDQAAFAGLALAVGLEAHLFRDTPESDRAYLEGRLRGLPSSLRCLVAETDAAIGNAALSYRG